MHGCVEKENPSLEKTTFYEKLSEKDILEDYSEDVKHSLKKLIETGYKLVYAPEASVYHYHGIHQGGDKERLRGVVKVLEDHDLSPKTFDFESSNYEICAVIPIMGDIPSFAGKSALDYTLEAIKKSKLIDYIVVAADKNETIQKAIEYGVQFCFLRPAELSEPYITVWDVIKYSISQLREKGKFPDIVIYTSVTNPFRPNRLIDEIVSHLIDGHFDRVIPSINEYRSAWVTKGGSVVRIDEGYLPHDYKLGIKVGIGGLGTASFTDYILNQDLVDDAKIGLLELEDITCAIDIRDKYGKYLADNLLNNWWNNNLD